MSVQANPGSINFRLGQTLSFYEQAVQTRQLETAAAMLDVVASYISVHLSPAEWREYEAMPGFLYGDNRTPSQVYADLNAKLRHILAKAKTHGVFARAEVELGDTDDMDKEVEA